MNTDFEREERERAERDERDKAEAEAMADLSAEAEADRLYVKVDELKARIKELEAERALLLGFARRARARAKLGNSLTTAPGFAVIYEDATEVLARFGD